MGIVTKKGDDGKTQMLSGERASKSDIRLEIEGCIDEFNSSLGFARSLLVEANLNELADEIRRFQLNIFRLGSMISLGDNKILENPIAQKDIDAIEERILTLEESIKLPRSFLVPGATKPSAALEIARAVARRLERRMVEAEEGGVFKNMGARIWINRASDYIFLLARIVERRIGVDFDAS